MAAVTPLQLLPATNMFAGAAALDVGTYAIPCVADWNGDGKKDLLVGYQPSGMIRLYTNSGTDASPVFSSYSTLQAGGTNIQHTSGGCGAPAPWVCDYDRDGKLDLVVGSGGDGRVNFYRNTNNNLRPMLTGGLLLSNGIGPISVSYRAAPYTCDWNEDGRQDLLCGSGDGYFLLFLNTNSNTNPGQRPIYTAPARIKAGGADLIPGIRSVIRVCDWDGDGLKDVVCSSDTGVYWCRNTNRNSEPILQARIALPEPVAGSGLVNINTGGRMRLDLADWNNDGVMDLLLGNADGTVRVYRAYRFALISLNRMPGGGVVLQWNSAPYLKYNVCGKGILQGGHESKLATNLPSGGLSTSWTSSPACCAQFYHVHQTNAP
jgi:hypothetical protein